MDMIKAHRVFCSAVIIVLVVGNAAGFFYPEEMLRALDKQSGIHNRGIIPASIDFPSVTKVHWSDGKQDYDSGSGEEPMEGKEKIQKGHKGDKGDSGYPGLDGLPRQKGESGDTTVLELDGSKSIKECPPGDIGMPGLPGFDGLPGIPGQKGEPGLQGSRGPPGMKALNTLPGLKGEPGLPGLPGLTGNTGEHGIPGQKGKPGFSGPRGKRGHIARVRLVKLRLG